jgi:proline utilization trans-activator
MSDMDPNLIYDFGVEFMEADGIYSSFNDPHLPLTGVDQLDWEEMERVFAARSN